MFGLLLFYGLGFGMLGTLGAAAAVGSAIAFYVLQIFLARAWMTRFRLGPVEWLWRSLTYFKLQPNSRGVSQAGVISRGEFLRELPCLETRHMQMELADVGADLRCGELEFQFQLFRVDGAPAHGTQLA